MPKSRIILALGFFIALLPVLGFPNSWDHFFDTATGLLIVLLSVLISVDRRLMLKAKAEKRSQRKRAISTPPVADAPAPRVEPEPEQVVVEPAPEPTFSAPTVSPEPTPAPEHEIPVIEAVPDFTEPTRPRRRRRVRVIDAEQSTSNEPSTPEAFDTSSEF